MRKDIKQRAARRLKIIEGQIRGLRGMIEKEVYCVNILHQSLAIKMALSSVEDLILENHLSTHVVHQMKTGKVSRATKEILDIYKLSKRK